MFYPKTKNLFERGSNRKLIEGKFSDPHFYNLNRWWIQEKLDGTNIRIEYYPSIENPEIIIGGRTNNSEIPEGIISYIKNIDLLPKMIDMFCFKPVTIFGEGVGPKIQKNGELYCESQKFMAFDINVHCEDVTSNKNYWLNMVNFYNVCEKLNLESVDLMGHDIKLIDIIEIVKEGFSSYLWCDPEERNKAEGVIARTDHPLFDSAGNRIMFKLKTKDFR